MHLIDLSRGDPPPVAPPAHAGRQGPLRPPRRPRGPGARAGRYLALRPDRVVFQDVLGQTGMLQFMQTGRDRGGGADHHPLRSSDPGATRTGRVRSARIARRERRGLRLPALRRRALRRWLLGTGRRDHAPGGARELRVPRASSIIGTDSHTPNAGGLGRVRGGRRAAPTRWRCSAGLPWELLYPRAIAVYLTGRLSGWTAPKDVILLSPACSAWPAPPTRSSSTSARARGRSARPARRPSPTWAPSSARPRRCSPPTSAMRALPRATGRAAICRRRRAPPRSCSSRTRRRRPHPERYYDRVLRLDLSQLEPHVVGPHSPDRVRPISALAAEVRAAKGEHSPTTLSAALIGSCTNSSYEDMSRAADVARQARAHGVAAARSALVTPGSERVRATTERDGQLASLREHRRRRAGQRLRALHRPVAPPRKRRTRAPNSIVTSYNRNFPGRNDGAATTMNFIASPEIVTALALAGRLSFNPADRHADWRRWHALPPGAARRPAPEVPARFADRARAQPTWRPGRRPRVRAA